jgi:hypothetical protein
MVVQSGAETVTTSTAPAEKLDRPGENPSLCTGNTRGHPGNLSGRLRGA